MHDGTQCSVTENKNHRRITEVPIVEQTTDAYGVVVTYKWIGDIGASVGDGQSVSKMTSLICLVALALLGVANSEIVELVCSDNATCIDTMAREFVRGIKQHKTVKLFDMVTIEPIDSRQARFKRDPLTKLITSHAVSFDWNEFTFRFSNPEARSDSMDLEVFDSRSVKDDSDTVPKKSKNKEDVEEIEDKPRTKPKPVKMKRRRTKHKVMQAVIPLLFGMKSAGIAIFGLFMASVITIKAFLASKMALLVTVGMAMKKIYESYGTGAGLQSHPYLYSQYPIDFPSATSHTYSVNGVSSQFATPEMYSPTAMGSNTQTHELLQSSDASAQQSQQAPTQLLANTTRAAAERWDGKSKLFKIFEPVVDKIRSFVNPIANVFYGVMPTFRGLGSDVTKAKSVEPEFEEQKRPREILVPQPRNIAQRKMFRKAPRHIPKKYVEFKIDLNRLKYIKDYLDYVKTKKYKYNYPHTYYYPRVKYFVNPNTFYQVPDNNVFTSYKKPNLRRNINIGAINNMSETTTSNITLLEPTDWKPVITNSAKNSNPRRHKMRKHRNKNRNAEKIRRKKNMKKRKRAKRSLESFDSINFNTDHKENVDKSNNNNILKSVNNLVNSHRGLSLFFDFLFHPFATLFNHMDVYANNYVRKTLKSKDPPAYYSIAYTLLMYTLDSIEGILEVDEALKNYVNDGVKLKKTKKKKVNFKKNIDDKILLKNNTLQVNAKS